MKSSNFSKKKKIAKKSFGLKMLKYSKLRKSSRLPLKEVLAGSLKAAVLQRS